MKLGEHIFTIAACVLVLSFVLGWIAILFGMAMQALLPSRKEKIEKLIQGFFKPFAPIQKYSFYVMGGIFAVYILGQMLGWIPPSPPPDDPYEFKYGPGNQ